METRSKKKQLIEKEITPTDYDKMCKVRVLLQIFNFDAFRKTGEIISPNTSETDNVHVSKFHKKICVLKNPRTEKNCDFCLFQYCASIIII